jgi:hypothetical protein
LQIAMFLLAGAVIADGLAGTQVAPINLAGVLPWIYWRALAVIALLVAGNLFCMVLRESENRRAMRRIRGLVKQLEQRAAPPLVHYRMREKPRSSHPFP